RFSLRQQNIDLAQLRDDLFGFVLLLGHSNVLLRLNSLLQGGPLFRGQTNLRFYQTPEQVEAILSVVEKADVASTDWKMIADETDEDVPEMVKAVYRKGEDRNRHLILLDDHGAGFFGLELKPRPSNVNIKVPDAHVDLHVRGDQILITFWDGDQRNTVTLTEEDPADWQKALDEARNSPAGLVVDELYHGELNGDGKFDRDEDE
uniref:hypothetical protein n=1 Tax=Ochrobactrum sp. CGA5 TaxID=2583453 RepID=UPI0015D65452